MPNASVDVACLARFPNACTEHRQAFGTRAWQFMAELAFGQTVTLHTYGRDKYDRTIADVFLPDGRMLNQELVKAGLAWWYRRYAPGDTVLEGLEKDARDAKQGLWVDPNPIPPWEWRKLGRAKGP